jgi:hypothetical protein
MHRTISLRMTARSRRTDKAHRAAIDQLVRDAAQRKIGSSSDLLLVKRLPRAVLSRRSVCFLPDDVG